MKREVLTYINKHQLIEGPATVIVGVSGGPDSMALLHLLHQSQKELNIDLIALSIDHQLRGEASLYDSKYVEDVCKRWSIRFVQRDVDVKSYVKKYKVSQQTASRELRYQAYKKVLKDTNAKYLALGHHADDQVETMLMALTKVTQPEVLSGIPITRDLNGSKLIRPLLCVNKRMIDSYCKINEINPRFDASNDDLNYERNYFRKKIVPLLEERNPNIYKTLQIMSENLQEDNRFLEEEALKLFDLLIVKNKNSYDITIDRIKFNEIAKPLQRRLYKLTLDYLYMNKQNELSYEHELIFMKLMREDSLNSKLDFPLGLKIEKSYDKIHLYFEKNKEKPSLYPPLSLHIGDMLQIDNDRTLSSELIKGEVEFKTDNPDVYYLEANSVEFPLHVRKRMPGDRISWQGLEGSKKVKDILIDKKVPRNKRDELLVVTDNKNEVLWLIGFVKGLPKRSIKKAPYVKLEYKDTNLGGY